MRPGGIEEVNRYTAAHKSLPFNTLVKLSYGSKCIVVRINDSGPITPGRILDLREEPATYLYGNPKIATDLPPQWIEVVSKADGYEQGPGCSSCGKSQTQELGSGDSYSLSISKPESGCGATKVHVFLVSADGRFKTGAFARGVFEGGSSLSLPMAQFIRTELAKPATTYTKMLIEFKVNESALGTALRSIPAEFLSANAGGASSAPEAAPEAASGSGASTLRLEGDFRNVD